TRTNNFPVRCTATSRYVWETCPVSPLAPSVLVKPSPGSVSTDFEIGFADVAFDVTSVVFPPPHVAAVACEARDDTAPAKAIRSRTANERARRRRMGSSGPRVRPECSPGSRVKPEPNGRVRPLPPRL